MKKSVIFLLLLFTVLCPALGQTEYGKELEAKAAAGDAAAQYDLGKCYYQGKGVAADYVKAFEWFMKSAGQGYADAVVSLGVCYFEGKGTISGNYADGTRGFVVTENSEVTIKDNSFGENAVDIAIIPNGEVEDKFVGKTAELSAANNNCYVENQPSGEYCNDGKTVNDIA